MIKISKNKLDFSERVEVRFSKETLEKLDMQKKKYGISTRNDYLRLLVEIDLLTDIVEIINYKKSKQK